MPSGVDEYVFDCYVLCFVLDCILECWFALGHKLSPDKADIDLEAITECRRGGAVGIARPQLDGAVLGQLAKVGEARYNSLIREERLKL